MSKNELIKQDELLISKELDIKTMIYEIRGKKVMLDSDLARLYGYEVKRLNEQVQRNIERFPSDFMWKLSKEECDEFLRSKFLTLKDDSLRSQFATLNSKGNKQGMHIKYLPYVFTEQGIYALSGILKGPLATSVSINLIRAFKQLKDFYFQNNYLLDRVIDNEVKLLEYQKDTNNKINELRNDSNIKFNQIFDYINDHKEVTEKIFFKGQVYDAYKLFSELIPKANKEIILIDNYIDINTLEILKNKKKDVNISIYTSNNKLTNIELDKFNKQYPTLIIKKTNKFHDRFLILDNKTIYLIGASIKDAGNKCFGIVEIDKSNIKRIIEEL